MVLGTLLERKATSHVIAIRVKNKRSETIRCLYKTSNSRVTSFLGEALKLKTPAMQTASCLSFAFTIFTTPYYFVS